MFRNGLQGWHILVLLVVILLLFGAQRRPAWPAPSVSRCGSSRRRSRTSPPTTPRTRSVAPPRPPRHRPWPVACRPRSRAPRRRSSPAPPHRPTSRAAPRGPPPRPPTSRS